MTRRRVNATGQAGARRRRRSVDYGPSFGSEVVVVTLLSAGLAGVALTGITQSQPFLSAAGLVGLVVLFATFTIYKMTQVQPDAGPIVEPKTIIQEVPTTKTVRVTDTKGRTREVDARLPDIRLVSPEGKEFLFTGRQHQQLCLWRETGRDGGGIRRDTSPMGFGFDQLEPPITSERYSLAVAVLEECNYIARMGSTMKWTRLGEVDFLDYDPYST